MAADEAPQDVRQTLHTALSWRFSFPSGDPHAVRCLVAHPADSSRVAEWLVRELPTLGPSGDANKRPQELHPQPQTQMYAEGLEALLERELGFGAKPLAASTEIKATRDDDVEILQPATEHQKLSTREVLERLYGDIPWYLVSDSDPKEATSSLFKRQATPRSAHLATLRGVVQLRDSDIHASAQALAVFDYATQSLQDVLKYNRGVLQGDSSGDGEGSDSQSPEHAESEINAEADALADLKKRLVVFQLRRALHFLHARGLACDGFCPRDLQLTDTLWLRLAVLPRLLAACGTTKGGTELDEAFSRLQGAKTAGSVPRGVEDRSSRSLTTRWCVGDVGNLEYLLALNAAAGRRLEDGVFHPFVPWITDFTSGPHAGWRDLSKSKFRLNKGDAQLDRTFASSAVPHHVTESLSEITYYIYAARRTPMALLRRVVRSDFKAKEYPASLARMFQWTPDECIPEFYTDARIFTSLHGDDMADLQFPEWQAAEKHESDAAVAFVRVHRAMLESDSVSAQLHHWIDLNFGAALSGEAAVREKNVPLPPARTAGKSPGFVQLFRAPHPRKKLLRRQETAVRGSRRTSSTASSTTSRMLRLQGSPKEVDSMLTRAMQLLADTQNDGAPASSPSQSATVSSSLTTGTGANGDSEVSRFALLHSQSSGSGGTSNIAHSSSMGPSTSPVEATRSQVMMRSLKQRRRGGSKPRARSHAHVIGAEPLMSPPSFFSGTGREATDAPPAPLSGGSSASRLGNFFHTEPSNTSSNSNSGGPGGGGAFPMTSEASQCSGSSPPTSSGPYSNPRGAGAAHSRALTSSGGPTEHLRVLTISTPLGVSGDGPGGSTTASTVPHHTRHSSLGSGSPNTGSHLLRDLWQQLRQPEDDGGNSSATGGHGHHHSHSTGHELLLASARGDMMALSDLDGDGVGVPDANSPLDDMDVKLLQLGLPIVLPIDDVSGVEPQLQLSQENTQLSESTVDADEVVDPVYVIPAELRLPSTEQLSPLERAQAADLFSLGCVTAELYTHTPVFSRRSLEAYLASYKQDQTQQTLPNKDGWISGLLASQQQQRLPWNRSVAERLTGMPLNLKQAVLDMLHPDPSQRLQLASAIDSRDPTALAQSSLGATPRSQSVSSTPDSNGFLAAPSALFPKDFAVVYRFLAALQQAPVSDWRARLTTSRRQLPALARLEPLPFRVVLPELATFFRASSHTEPICAERVTAAVVFLLPELARQLGRVRARRELLRDVMRVYESAELARTPLLRCCLAAPRVLLSLLQAFGPAAVLDHLIPAVLEWLVPPVTPATGALLPFAGESAALTAVTCGELASPVMLGPALTAKYVLPGLLNQLGRTKSRWTKLARVKTLRRTDKQRSISDGIEDVGATIATTPATAEMHLTFLSKSKLYESHHTADAVLQVCRELGEFPVGTLLLPRLFEVLPRLVTLAEEIGAVRLEGVPEELAREIYVLLRILRHVVRTLNDATALQELLSRRPRSNLMELLAQTAPPFLHPRMVAAVIAAATTAATTTTTADEQSATGRRTRTASGGSSLAKKQALRSLSFLKDADHRSLRAFTVVGLARTIVAVCQKLGAEATLNDALVVGGVNRFLKRCSLVYAELEVSNFQWHLASELVSELCVPLRALVGREAFERHFPVVAASSVLQLLLLPLGNTAGAGDSRAKLNESRNLSALDDRLAQSQTQMQQRYEQEEDEEEDENDEVTEDEAGPGADPTAYAPELLRFAYHAVRLHSVRATSFLHVPSALLLGSGRAATQWESALSEELLLLQEARRQRKMRGAALASERAVADAVWLRPRVRRGFEPGSSEDGNGSSAMEANESFGSSSGGLLGGSFFLGGDVRQSIKAHSSAVRCASVDADEELLLTGSRHGSCRVWRLAGHPIQARAAVAAGSGSTDNRPVIAVARVSNSSSGDSNGLALAASASGLLLWDLRTSQARLRLPFQAASEPLVAMAAGGSSPADAAVATSRRVLLLDARSGPRVVAEWRADACSALSGSGSGAGSGLSGALGAGLSLSAVAPFEAASGASYVAVGSASGRVVLLDARTGRQAARWQALEPGARIVRLTQLSASQLLVIGAEKEARVWRLPLRGAPRLRLRLAGVPEGLRAGQVAVQSAEDGAVLFVAGGSRVLAAKLPSERQEEGETSLTAKMESWPMAESGASGKLGKSRSLAQSVAVMPLRQLLLLGAEDGSLKCVV